MKDSVKRLLWFGVSTLIIAVTILFADIERVIDSLRQAELVWFAPALVLGLSVFGVWSYTWWSFFRKMELNISYRKSLKMFMAGHFLNSVTPLGQFGGEPLMAYIISKNTGASYEKSFSTVFSADIVNAVPMFTFVIGGAAYLLIFGSQVNQLILQTVYMAVLTTIVGGTVVYLLWFKAGYIEDKLLKLLEYFERFIPRGDRVIRKVDRSLDKVQDAFETVGEDPLHLFRVAVVAHLGFLLQLFCLYFLLLAVGLEADFTPLYFVLTISSLANFTPTPGGSGTFEAAMAGLLNFFTGLPFPSAISVAVMFRLTTYWPGLFIGWIAMNTLERPDK